MKTLSPLEISICPNYYRAYPNHAKFEGLLSICNAELYKRLSIFIRKAAEI
jgi:hypothetical protein